MQDFQTKSTTPIVLDKGIDSIRLFVDKSHPIFASCDIPVEQLVATEVAKYLYDSRSRDIGKPLHTISNLTWCVLRSKWSDGMSQDRNSMLEQAQLLLGDIKERLFSAHGERLSDYVDSMEDEQKKRLTASIVDSHIPFDRMESLAASGAYIKFAPSDFLLTLFAMEQDLFFDGKVWDDAIDAATTSGFVDQAFIAETNKRARQRILTCLESVVHMVDDPDDDKDYLQLIASSFLLPRMISGCSQSFCLSVISGSSSPLRGGRFLCAVRNLSLLRGSKCKESGAMVSALTSRG